MEEKNLIVLDWNILPKPEMEDGNQPPTPPIQQEEKPIYPAGHFLG